MSRGRSPSPRRLDGSDVERSVSPPVHDEKASNLKVIVITNLTRNVVESHLRTIFGFYGKIRKIDLPLFGKCTLLTAMWVCDIDIILKLVKIGARLLWNISSLLPRKKRHPT